MHACVRAMFSPAPSVLGSTFCMADHQEEDCLALALQKHEFANSCGFCVIVARRSRGQLKSPQGLLDLKTRGLGGWGGVGDGPSGEGVVWEAGFCSTRLSMNCCRSF